jgi:hypothetical protein
MQAGTFWQCPECGKRNKSFAAVCFICGRERRGAPLMTGEGRSVERVGVSRTARALVVSAFAAAAILGFFLVRTFRSPALEAADTQTRQKQAAVDDTGREPVPPQATMPGAPDSGWMATSAGTAEPPPAPPIPTNIDTGEAGSSGPSSYVPSVPRVAPARRTYTDADLRAIAAARGAAAARDLGYVAALRQRRVDDLRARIAAAKDADERQTLQKWLDGAMDDLERARRQ